MKLSGLGDVVQALAVAVALKERDPSARVTWIAMPTPARLLRPHPAVDRVVVFERGRGWAGAVNLWRRTRGLEHDVALNMETYLRGVLPALLSGARRRVGFGPPRARELTWLFHHERLPGREERHTQDLYLEFAEWLGADVEEPDWGLAATDEERRRREAFLGVARGNGGRGDAGRGGADGAGPTVGLVLASARPEKDWPAERCAELARRLRRRHGARVVLVGGPSEREAAAAERVLRAAGSGASDAPGGVVDGRGDDPRRLVWLLEACDVAVAPDTGPLHVAVAVGTPVVGLFGHTNPWRVGPYRHRDLVVDRYTDPDEEPDPARRGPRHGRMERIEVEEVLVKVERGLQR